MIEDILAGFVSGALGAMGFGGGGILILYLTIYKDTPQFTAQGINLIFFIPAAVIALIKHKKNNLIDTKISKDYIFSGAFGIAIGYLIINYIDEKLLKTIFALILISFGLKELFSKKEKRG